MGRMRRNGKDVQNVAMFFFSLYTDKGLVIISKLTMISGSNFLSIMKILVYQRNCESSINRLLASLSTCIFGATYLHSGYSSILIISSHVHPNSPPVDNHNLLLPRHLHNSVCSGSGVSTGEATLLGCASRTSNPLPPDWLFEFHRPWEVMGCIVGCVVVLDSPCLQRGANHKI